MKKLLIATAIFIGFSGIASAQQQKVAAPAKTETKTEGTTTTVKAVKLTPGVKTVHVTKADGTPDMRLKVNKEAARTKKLARIKKDGTPDMRYKENREKVKKG